MRLQSRQRAFTLVELLVVIAIIGILIALLVPAVQMVRETARRSACTNKQKNIAVALQAYHSNKQFFPRMASGTYNPATGSVARPVWSWTVFVLPYLEGQNISDVLNPNLQPAAAALNDPLLAATMQTKLGIFLCGSDNPPELNSARIISFAGRQYEVATTNYVGSNAAGALDILQYGVSPPPMSSEFGCTFGTTIPGAAAQGRGLFSCMREYRTIEEIEDGQSNTIALGERAWEYGPRNNKQISGAANLYVGRPFSGFGYDPGQGAGDMCANSGVGINVSNSSDPFWNPADSYSSSHPAGANFAFIDGSTQFLSREIDVVTFQRLAAIDDQLIIGEY